MTIIVLEGDETGQELLEEALRVLDPAVVGLPLAFVRVDLRLAARRRTANRTVREAADALLAHRFGIKAATITPESPHDVGSPNALLREWIGATVILRAGRRIPGVRPVTGVVAPIVIVRMAVGDAYSAEEWREGDGLEEVARRTTTITRLGCRQVAEFAFRHAARTGAKVFGGPKYTVSPVYEGLLKEEMDAAAARHPEVPYDPQLIDAVFALLLQSTGEGLVVPALNRDGDILSDLVMQMFGSVAGAESVVLSLDADGEPRVVLTEAPHGTAPRLYGRNVANPMAMILAGAALLSYLPSAAARAASRAVYEATMDAVQAGVRTVDLGGEASTTEFTDEVIRRVRARLEARPSAGPA